MVYIDTSYDMTLTPSTNMTVSVANNLFNSPNEIKKKTFNEARNENSIYQNNGLICQNMMCQSMTGCENINECKLNKDYNKILDFCGPIQTNGRYMDGAYWNLQNANSHTLMLLATEKAIGTKILPTPYNQSGMY